MSILWIYWWNAIVILRPVFSRWRTFLWFVTVVAGLTIRNDFLGISSVVRVLNLEETHYYSLIHHFRSRGIRLNALTVAWTKLVRLLFKNPVLVNGRLIVVGDGIKIPKAGKKMPAVRWMHQSSESNTKPEYIMGHSLQSIGLLVHASASTLLVPLAARIHEGLTASKLDKRTLLDKMIALLRTTALDTAYYFVGDAYYASGKMTQGLLNKNNHLITRVKTNAVACQKPVSDPNVKRTRGRPRRYGDKNKLNQLFDDSAIMTHASSPVYSETKEVISYCTCDLLWRPAGRLVRFVAVIHPVRGRCLLMTTDITLDPLEIIRLYSLRFKIEVGFKAAVRSLGIFLYHFWSKNMEPTSRMSKGMNICAASRTQRRAILRKIHACHLFISAGIIAQSLLHYLSVSYPKQVWDAFGSWLRTVRPGIPPSEMVVATALRNTLPYFLLNCAKNNTWAKFIAERQCLERLDIFRLAG